MGKVDVQYKSGMGTTINKEYGISKLELASCYFRVQGAKPSLSHILASVGKFVTIYSLLDNSHYALVKSDEYSGADPTEKAFYSYLLGMATCKWVSEKLFRINHLQYFSLARNTTKLGTKVSGKNCPDLIGQDISGKYILFEAKGTSGLLNKDQIRYGKNQLNSISISGTLPTGVVTECYFNKSGNYSIYAEDPKIKDYYQIEYDSQTVLRNYYHNIIQLLKYEMRENNDEFIFRRPILIDKIIYTLQIGLKQSIYHAYKDNNFESIESITKNLENYQKENKYFSSDGISFQIINTGDHHNLLH